MITAILQARLGSSRLPRKVLLPLAGQPLLWHVIRRVQASQHIQQIVVATTTQGRDDELADYVAGLGVAVFRGAEQDVLDRYYQAAQAFSASVIVRLTADCPLLDPTIIDQTIAFFLSGSYDYVSNCLGAHRTFPDGLDTEVLTFSALETAWREARLPSEREHVTPYLYKNPQRFRVAGWLNGLDHSAERWTIDEPSDYAFLQKVYPAVRGFGMQAVLAVLEQNPAWRALNAHLPTNAGYQKSLQEDSP
jgi:spore coat polysaccharide biosynthesis protein SpsF